jgi:hypothetical protein
MPIASFLPQYGKSLDWKNEQFTTHDVASVFRRYLTQMPVCDHRTYILARMLSLYFHQEPVIPYNMYHDASSLSIFSFSFVLLISTFSFEMACVRSGVHAIVCHPS